MLTGGKWPKIYISLSKLYWKSRTSHMKTFFSSNPIATVTRSFTRPIFFQFLKCFYVPFATEPCLSLKKSQPATSLPHFTSTSFHFIHWKPYPHLPHIISPSTAWHATLPAGLSTFLKPWFWFWQNYIILILLSELWLCLCLICWAIFPLILTSTHSINLNKIFTLLLTL